MGLTLNPAHARDGEAPKLSVIIVLGPRRDDAAQMLAAMAAQTLALSGSTALELVLVDTRPDAPLSVPAALGALMRVVRVAAPQQRSYTQARLLGLAASCAPVVAWLEDHCFPEPGWAAALVDAHTGPWAAISYRIANENGETWLGRAAALADFGPWDHTARRETRYLASSNVSYKRAVLDRYRDDLATLLSPDQVFFEVLERAGERLCVEGTAVARHKNITSPRWMAVSTMAFSRMHAANRAATLQWSRPRRLVWGALAPWASVPLRSRTLLSTVRRAPALAPQVAASWPVFLPSFIASGVGASLGYLFGAGSAEQRFTHVELVADRV